jgi:hypothetical protein
LWQAYAALGRLLRHLQLEAPLTPGSLYLLRRKCGKPTCRCAQGHLHETWVLTRSEQGQTKLYPVPPEQRGRVRQLTQAYRRYQRRRAQWVKRTADLLAQIDAFTEVQLVPWPPPPA